MQNPLPNMEGDKCYMIKLGSGLRSFYLAGAKATRTYNNGLMCSIDVSSDFSKVWLPGSGCFAV